MTDRHERLRRALRPLDDAEGVSAERTAEILRERARALARPQAATIDRAARIELVTFRLGAERYGIEARFALGILRDVGVTPVPGLPEHFSGVTNLRGEILAVVDLARFLGVERAGASARSRLIVLGVEAPELGILADDTDEVVSLDEAALHAPGAVLGGGRRPYLRGVTEDALVVLDGAALLADERFFHDEGDDGAPARGRGG